MTLYPRSVVPVFDPHPPADWTPFIPVKLIERCAQTLAWEKQMREAGAKRYRRPATMVKVTFEPAVNALQICTVRTMGETFEGMYRWSAS